MAIPTVRQNRSIASKRALLQSGGEGAVYVQRGKAVKIYHRPTTQRSEKLRAFVAQRLLQQLPAGVLGPERLVVDGNGTVNGFEMALLPATAQPWKKLSQPAFCLNFGVDLAHELDLLIGLHRDLKAIHAAQVIVGDLNDHNIFFDFVGVDPQSLTNSARSYWIDVDSFQFGHFPCPVALASFLDPLLYDEHDFVTKPVFSRASDWYAFTVLLCKTLLKTHPFGGTHHQLKSLQSRATARVSVLHPSVGYPKGARPATVLDDPMLRFLRRVFESDDRQPIPATLLETLRHNLTRCAHCGQTYASSRSRCPVCQERSPIVRPANMSVSLSERVLCTTEGLIVAVFVKPTGRIVAITRRGSRYRLLQLGVGGLLRDIPLFTGPAGVRFSMFQDVLVVNVPSRRELLLLEVSAHNIHALAALDSECFDGEAAFAATPEALYRIANGYVLRGRARRGTLLEEIVTSAHRWRTQLWASPRADIVAGYHRLFAAHHFFLLDQDGRQQVFTPGTPASSTPRSIVGIDIAWGQHSQAFIWHERGNRRLEMHAQLSDHQGRTLMQWVEEPAAPPFDRLGGKLVDGLSLLHPTDGGILKINPQSHTLLGDVANAVSARATLHWHPRGVLIQEAGSLVLAETLT